MNKKNVALMGLIITIIVLAISGTAFTFTKLSAKATIIYVDKQDSLIRSDVKYIRTKIDKIYEKVK